MIVVEDLAKHYRVHRRAPGMAAALRSVFRRQYDEVRAVDGVSFRIEQGARVGFLGPNGAGKTTTLKMLSGLLHPTRGRVEVLGYVPRARDVAFLSSIMLVTGQKQQLIWDLPPAETFELNRAIYEVPRPQFKATIDELVTLLDLSRLIHTPTRQLSMGERMKCELAAALIHRPKILFLDEPTIGLDVTMQATVRDFIRTYNQRHGATVLLTSHDMDDVAAIAERIIVIDHGRLSFDGSLDALVHQLQPEKRVRLSFSEAVDEARVVALGARVVEREAQRAVLQVPTAELRRVVAAALEQLPVSDLTVEGAPLEEVLAELFARGRAAAATPTPSASSPETPR
jgi:ABC-2 type transport system ATP-binding protein